MGRKRGGTPGKRRMLLAICSTGVACGAWGQAAPASGTAEPAAAAQSAPAQMAGGTVHGSVKSGVSPLPGVSVTATNTLTGSRYATTTGLDGTFALHIPEDGRYVIRTDFAAFAEKTAEIRFGGANGGPRDVAQDFGLLLVSRVPAQTEDRGALGGAGATAGRGGFRAYGGGGRRGGSGDSSQMLSLLGEAAGAVDAGGGSAAGGGGLPSLGGSSDFAADSVAVSGQQNGGGNSFAGIDFNAVRERAESDPGLGGGGGFGGGGGRGGRGGGGGGFGGGFGGGGGSFSGSFRHFNPNQPHGALFWTGGNGALNALSYALKGQEQTQPSYASNKFGLTFAGTPYIPHVIENDRRDFLFFNLSGSRASSPTDLYGTVPSAAERTGNFSGLTTTNGALVPVYDPQTGLPFANNTVPGDRVQPQAAALLNYVPLPNLPGASNNYHRLTSAETNTTTVGVRFVHSLGATHGPVLAGLVRQYMGVSQGLQQSVNVNYNYSHSAADTQELFEALGGKTATTSNSLQLGYVLSVGKLTNHVTLNWNRANSQKTNYFTSVNDIANSIGLNVFNGVATNPLAYGLPNITLTQFDGLNEVQPGFTTNQTLALGEASTWTHHKHNVRWGVDFRRVHLDEFGNTGNMTGSYTFSGLFTQAPGSNTISGAGNTTQTGQAASGSSLADLLLGLPQQTEIQASYAKAYLRENAYDAYVQDDWRVFSNFSVVAGLRWEYFSPYSEKNDRLAALDPGNNFASVAAVTANGIGAFSGKYPRGLIYPEKDAFSPRLGIAWRAPKNTVVRAGYGINFQNGQYNKFVQDFAFQPPFADVQTNEATNGVPITLANGFPAPQAFGNYAVNKNFKLPYIQLWNINVQHTMPKGVVLNVGYNGSKGTRLDIVDAPGRDATGSLSGVLYDYEDSSAFSNFNALTVSARKRLQQGVSMGATYTYAHSIDNSTLLGGAVAQNWQNLLAEESNSSFDVRHKVTGNFLYELPLGPDKHFLTIGRTGRALEGLSLSGDFTFATGEPLTPNYVASVDDVARGSTGSLRPDRVPGVSLTNGAGTASNWFNSAAFSAPANVYGNASRYSIPGPGTVSIDSSLSKTVSLGQTRSFEVRATAANVFNTVQYAGVSTQLGLANFGQVTSAASMRQFTFTARFRY